MFIDDNDAKAMPIFPKIDTYACAASLCVAELSIALGTNIIDPGCNTNSSSGRKDNMFWSFE